MWLFCAQAASTVDAATTTASASTYSNSNSNSMSNMSTAALPGGSSVGGTEDWEDCVLMDADEVLVHNSRASTAATRVDEQQHQQQGQQGVKRVVAEIDEVLEVVGTGESKRRRVEENGV